MRLRSRLGGGCVAAFLLAAVLSGLPQPVAAQQTQIVKTTLLSAVSAGTTSATIDGPINGNSISIIIETSAGVSSGVVTVEEASSASYAGTWSVISAVSTTAASTTTVVHVGGLFGAVRVRISTAIVGGTVTVYSLVGR